MPWLTRDRSGHYHLWDLEPIWDDLHGYWAHCIGTGCGGWHCPILAHCRNTGELEPGECVKVKLVRDDD